MEIQQDYLNLMLEQLEKQLKNFSIILCTNGSYMLNPCSAPNKYVVIMLNEDISIKSVAIINQEFYSSNAKEIEVLQIPIFIYFFIYSTYTANLEKERWWIQSPKICRKTNSICKMH